MSSEVTAADDDHFNNVVVPTLHEMHRATLDGRIPGRWGHEFNLITYLREAFDLTDDAVQYTARLMHEAGLINVNQTGSAAGEPFYPRAEISVVGVQRLGLWPSDADDVETMFETWIERLESAASGSNDTDESNRLSALAAAMRDLSMGAAGSGAWSLLAEGLSAP